MCMRNPTHIYSNGKSTKLSNLNMTNKPSFPNTDSTTNSTKSTDNYKFIEFSQVEYDSSIDPLNMVQYSPKIYKVTKLNGIPVSADSTDAINTNTNMSEDNKNNLPSYADLYSQSPLPSYELKDFNNKDKNVKNLNDIPLPVSSIDDESEKKNSKAHSFAFYMFLWFCITWFVTGNFHYESVNGTMLLHIGYGNTGGKSSSVTSGGRGCFRSSKFGMKFDDKPADFAVDLTKIDNTVIIVD
ncbi:hypothetical protein B5S30_g1231 [[Candida] boidinii]|nr:hypothetical protein B5S30_g1231 [[Candida] boidinii]